MDVKKANCTWCNSLRFLAEWTGLEPATPGVTGRYSNQLNYHSAWSSFVGGIAAPSTARLGVP